MLKNDIDLIFFVLFSWYSIGRQDDAAERHLETLDNIRYYYAHVMNGVRLESTLSLLFVASNLATFMCDVVILNGDIEIL